MNRSDWELQVNNHLALVDEDKLESKYLDFYWANNWGVIDTASRIRTNLLGCAGVK